MHDFPMDHDAGGDFGYQGLTLDDGPQDLDDFQYHPTVARRESFGQSFSQKISALNLQASRKFDEILRMPDPLRLNLDLDAATTFLDDLRSYAVVVPAVVPNVVRDICSRLLTNDPHISYLALELLDYLVKNTGSKFHRFVASQPLMSNIARVARGTIHKPVFVEPMQQLKENLKSGLRTAKEKISAEMDGAEARQRLQRQNADEKADQEHQLRLAAKKAREMIFTWGEGFECYEEKLPLFSATYNTLINEGVDFRDVCMSTPAILETPSNAVRIGMGMGMGVDVEHRSTSSTSTTSSTSSTSTNSTNTTSSTTSTSSTSTTSTSSTTTSTTSTTSSTTTTCPPWKGRSWTSTTTFSQKIGLT